MKTRVHEGEVIEVVDFGRVVEKDWAMNGGGGSGGNGGGIVESRVRTRVQRNCRKRGWSI